MNAVDSASVFTSYAGIEIRLIVNSFKIVQGNTQVLLSRYPVNLYRDDEMKTLFQAYHHRVLTGRMSNKDSLPDTTKKGTSVVNFASGNKFSYGFASGTTATVSMNNIAKNEKGANFLNSL